MDTSNAPAWTRRSVGSIGLAVSCMAGACVLDPLDSPVPGVGPVAEIAMVPAPTVDGHVERVDEPPRLSNSDVVRAEMDRLYQEELRVSGMRGAVNLEFIVGVDGRVDPSSVRVLTSPDPRLSDASVELARHLVFHPAERDGTPVPLRTQMPISWGAVGSPAREALLDDPRFANDTYYVNGIRVTRREALEIPAERVLVHTHLYRAGTGVGSQMNIVTTDASPEVLASPVIVFFRDPGSTRAEREAMRIEEGSFGCVWTKCGMRDGAEPLVLVDGVASDLDGMRHAARSPHLKSVEYLRTPYAFDLYGPGARDGAFVVTTH